jgi:hypothetical protein
MMGQPQRESNPDALPTEEWGCHRSAEAGGRCRPPFNDNSPPIRWGWRIQIPWPRISSQLVECAFDVEANNTVSCFISESLRGFEMPHELHA